MSSLHTIMEEQLKYKQDYINVSHPTDRSICKDVARRLERTIHDTLVKSSVSKTLFKFPFRPGCGREVKEMLTSYKLEPLLESSQSLHTVETVIVQFSLDANKTRVTLGTS